MSHGSQTLEPDPGLLARARRGDREAVDRIAARSYPRIRRWALAVTGDPDDAEDVTQEAVVRMIGALPDLEERGAFGVWLYRIVRSAALDRARSERRRRERVKRWAAARVEPRESGEGAAILDRLADRETRRAVEVFLGKLAPRQREVFDLVDLQGFAPSEVAEMLEVAPGTVRATLFRARRIIREALLERRPELEES